MITDKAIFFIRILNWQLPYFIRLVMAKSVTLGPCLVPMKFGRFGLWIHGLKHLLN